MNPCKSGFGERRDLARHAGICVGVAIFQETFSFEPLPDRCESVPHLVFLLRLEGADHNEIQCGQIGADAGLCVFSNELGVSCVLHEDIITPAESISA